MQNVQDHVANNSLLLRNFNSPNNLICITLKNPGCIKAHGGLHSVPCNYSSNQNEPHLERRNGTNTEVQHQCKQVLGSALQHSIFWCLGPEYPLPVCERLDPLSGPTDYWNNVDGLCSTWLLLRGWGWTLIAEDTTHLGHMSCRLKLDPASRPLCYCLWFQKILCKLPMEESNHTAWLSSNSCEPGRLPSWQVMYKGAKNVVHMLVASNGYLFGQEWNHTWY